MSTTSSKNFTTLYSGAGSVVPQGAYGNANVVSLLAVGTDGANTVTNIVATGNVSAAYFIGNGSKLTNITAGNITGNVNYANTSGTAQYVTANAQANITSVGTLTSLSVSGNVVGGNLITSGAVSAASASASGNITGGNLLTGGAITAIGNVTAANFFGNVFGNIVGNVDAAGSDTQIQFNTGNLLDASANLTFDKSTNVFKVTGNTTYPTAGLEISKNSIVGNVLFGNLVITNQFQASSRGPVVVDTTALIVGQDNAGFNTNATIQAIRNQALELTTTNAGAPAVYVGKYVSGNPSLTGNVDVRSSNVGGYAGTGNINLSGNVYVGRNAQGADTANARANLIVSDSVYISQNLSVTGNINFGNTSTTGNVIAGNFITAGNLFGNVIGATVSGVGTANVDIIQSGDNLGTTTLNLAANVTVVGGSATSVITSRPGSNLQLTTNQGGGSGQPRLFVDQYDPGVQAGNVDIRTGGGPIAGGFAANATVNISGNVRIGPYGPGVAPTSTGLNLEVAGNITGANIIGNGQYLTALPAGNITGTVGLAQYVTANAQANITSVGTLTSLSVSGNIDGGNLRTVGLVTATGNVQGGNVIVPVNGRYYGDFTSAITAGRTAFQTTATGTSAATNIAILPGINHNTSNTAFNSSFNLFASGDVGNSSIVALRQFGNLATLLTTNTGTATAGNLRIQVGASQINMLTSGNVGISNNLLANAIYDNGTGSIAVTTGNINATGNITAVNNIGANTLSAISYFSAPALFTNEITPFSGGPLQTTTSLSTITGNLSVTGNVSTGSFFRAQNYTAAALTAITGTIGQMAAVSDSAGGGNPNGMIAFWDTTNNRWSYIHDNSAV